MGVQLVGEKIDIAILLSGRFTIGSDTSAAWGNGKGATLKPDESGKKALYGKLIKNSKIVDSSAPTSPVAQPLVSKLRPLFPPGFATQ